MVVMEGDESARMNFSSRTVMIEQSAKSLIVVVGVVGRTCSLVHLDDAGGASRIRLGDEEDEGT